MFTCLHAYISIVKVERHFGFLKLNFIKTYHETKIFDQKVELRHFYTFYKLTQIFTILTFGLFFNKIENAKIKILN